MSRISAFHLPALGLVSALAVAPAMAQDGSGSTPSGMVAEPTEDQLRTAYAAALEDINARSVQHLGAEEASPLTIVLEDIHKLGCRELPRAGMNYDCRVERRIRRGDGQPVTDVVQLWFSYEDGAWVAR